MKKLIFIFLILLNQINPELSLPPVSRDKYKNYAHLLTEKTQGVDFVVTALNRQSTVTIFAIHDGKIEVGTSELAKTVAGDSNLYLFEGILQENNFA